MVKKQAEHFRIEYIYDFRYAAAQVAQNEILNATFEQLRRVMRKIRTDVRYLRLNSDALLRVKTNRAGLSCIRSTIF